MKAFLVGGILGPLGYNSDIAISVPEPMTQTLLIAGLIAIWTVSRRRNLAELFAKLVHWS